MLAGTLLRGWSRRGTWPWTVWVLWGAMLAYAGFFYWLSDVKASNFDAHNHDLSHMWQSVWNVGHGHGFSFTLTGDVINVPRLSVHADYFLILLAPLSWLWPHYSVLLAVQAIGVAAGAWFLQRIAYRWTGHSKLSLAVAGSYLLSGPLQFALLWHFHAVMLAPLCIFAAIEALVYRRRLGIVLMWTVLALMTKEQVGLIMGPLLAMAAGWSGQRRLGWWLGGASIGWSLLQFFAVIPWMRDSGNSHFVWEFYYGSIGATLPQQLAGLLNPRELIDRLWQGMHLKNVLYLLLPLAGLPLLAPLSWLAILAILPHWLSDNPSQHTLHATNHVLALVVLWLAATQAAAIGIKRRWWRASTVAWSVMVAATIGSIIMSPLPWSVYGDPDLRRRDPEVATLRAAHHRIPAAARVSYSRGVGAEFRDREYAWLLPHGITSLDYAVVFTSARTSTWPRFIDHDRRLNEFFQSTPAFETVYTQGRLSIYRRNWAVPLPPLPDLDLGP